MMRLHLPSWALRPAAAIAVLSSAAPSANAAAPPAQDPESNLVSELVVVARADGPAWWKVSKGGSIVWILGLPPSRTPEGMEWDRRTLERRLKGARAMLAPLTEWGQFGREEHAPVLTPTLETRVASAAARLGEPPRKYRTVSSVVMDLRFRYYRLNNLTHDTHDDIYQAAKRAGVRIVHPPLHKHVWRSQDLSPTDPEIAACMSAVVEEVETLPQRSRDAAAYWAVGDVQNMLAAAPPTVGYVCRRFWPGHWERTISFQTRAIAAALEQPGKVIAVVHTGHLAARDGILQRLRAQGYTVSDPARPLSE